MDISFDFQHSSALSAAGIILDIAGTWYLAKAFVLSKDRVIRIQAGTYWGFNITQLRSLFEQRYDAKFGIIHIIIGSTLQFMNSIGLSVTFPFALLLLFPLVCFCHWYNYHVSSKIFRDCIQVGCKKPEDLKLISNHFLDLSPTHKQNEIEYVIQRVFRRNLVPNIDNFVDKYENLTIHDRSKNVEELVNQLIGWSNAAQDDSIINDICDYLANQEQIEKITYRVQALAALKLRIQNFRTASVEG